MMTARIERSVLCCSARSALIGRWKNRRAWTLKTDWKLTNQKAANLLTICTLSDGEKCVRWLSLGPNFNKKHQNSAYIGIGFVNHKYFKSVWCIYFTWLDNKRALNGAPKTASTPIVHRRPHGTRGLITGLRFAGMPHFKAINIYGGSLVSGIDNSVQLIFRKHWMVLKRTFVCSP